MHQSQGNEPIWKTSAISGDPLFFMQDAGQPAASAKLLLLPKALPRLVKATGDVVYEAGRDFTWQPGRRELVLTPQTRIPFRTQVLLPPGSPDSIAASRDGKKHLLYGEGHFFHDQQVLASYEPAEAWSGPVPEADADGLELTRERLKAKEPLKVLVLGDSISTGANASGTVGASPGLMGYPDLVADGLRQRFGVTVELKNLGALLALQVPQGRRPDGRGDARRVSRLRCDLRGDDDGERHLATRCAGALPCVP